MNNFIFQTPGTIINEAGATARLGRDCRRDRHEPGAAGQRSRARQNRPAGPGRGRAAQRWHGGCGICRSPGRPAGSEHYGRTCSKARDFSADGVVGFGGGSSMDVAKLVAFLSCSGQNLAEIYGVGMAKGKRLPLMLVTTTAGTGSEVTPIAIVTTGEMRKKGGGRSSILPDIAVLDRGADRRAAAQGDGDDRDRCHGACHRGLHHPAEKEPDLRHSRAPGA